MVAQAQPVLGIRAPLIPPERREESHPLGTPVFTLQRVETTWSRGVSLDTLYAGVLPGVVQEGSELTLLGLSLEGLVAWSSQQPRILGGTGRQLRPERIPGRGPE